MHRSLIILAAALAPARASAAQPPSVLLVITDDQGWGDVRSHGTDRIDTPVLDRLAAEGARFERFYVSLAARGGDYAVALLYACPEEETGARIEVEAGGRRLEGTIERAHDPAPHPSPDRVPRGEVFEKDWARLPLGALRLDPGRARLTVRATAIPGRRALDLKGVVLVSREKG